jgi:hypothetical protein
MARFIILLSGFLYVAISYLFVFTFTYPKKFCRSRGCAEVVHWG